MEIAAIAGLVALGYGVSKLGATNVKNEGFRSLGMQILPQKTPPSDPAVPVPSEYYTVGIQQYMTQEEAAKVKELKKTKDILLQRLCLLLPVVNLARCTCIFARRKCS